MSIKITVEDTNLIQKQKKDGSGSYFKQIAYAWIPDQDGSNPRYPKEIQLMANRDNNGNPVAYALGSYTLHGSSFRANNYGQLELGYLSLKPLNEPAKSKAA